MIGRATTFLRVVRAAAPGMLRLLEDGGHGFPSGVELVHEDRIYSAITPGDFSQHVLSVSTGQLAVLPLGNVGWSDLGTPERATFAMTRSGLAPSWGASWQRRRILTFVLKYLFPRHRGVNRFPPKEGVGYVSDFEAWITRYRERLRHHYENNGR